MSHGHGHGGGGSQGFGGMPAGPRGPHHYRSREHRRRRMRRRGRRAYIRSVYFLPSTATLGNAICGFAAIYVTALEATDPTPDRLTHYFVAHRFVAAAYLIFLAMLFDALDGRLARFTRHTTDFGGQLDSLADVISFGAAPAFMALQLFKTVHPTAPPMLSRLVWGIGALYLACAAMRLARFNVSNEHGEQHHYSFLGLPSPGAAGAVASFILMQQDLLLERWPAWLAPTAVAIGQVAVWVLPAVVLVTGLLMISNLRYPHIVNRYLRGRRSIGWVVAGIALALLVVVAHRYVLAAGTLVYALWGLGSWLAARWRRHEPAAPAMAPPDAENR